MSSSAGPVPSFHRLPCGIVEAHLSALLDDALSGAARERLSAHVLHCRHCTAALTQLRMARDVLRRSATAGAQPAPDLSQRLLAIGQHARSNAPLTPPVPQTVTQTATVTPDAPSGRSRTVPVGMAVVLATLAAMTGIGWLSAPAPAAPLADPGPKAERAVATAMAAAPLGSAATAAVVRAPRTGLMTAPTRLAATPVRPGAALSQRELATLVAGTAGPTIAHDGVWQVAVSTADVSLAAQVRVQARPGQGSQFTVYDPDGRQVAASFVADTPGESLPGLAELQQAGLTTRDGQQVAGRSAVLLELSNRTGTHQRWWVDRHTGLLLRSETTVNGAVTMQAGFSQLHIRPAGEFLSHLQPQFDRSAAAASMSNSHALSLQTHGWFCREDLAGLPLVAAHGDSTVAPQRLRLTYGDGVQQVTVLQQPGHLPDNLPGFVRDPVRNVLVSPGWPTIVTWQSGDRVFVVAGMAPAPVLSDVVADLPHEDPTGRNPVDRVRAGWARVGGYVFG